MNYYYDMCIMLEMAWITLQCTERLCSASYNKHFSRGQAVQLVTSDPAHCHGGGGACLSAVAPLIPPPPPCSEHSALRLANYLSRCFSAYRRHQELN